MNHAMRLLVIVQKLWTRYGFWVGVTILLGLLSRTDSRNPTVPEIFWYRVFLPINTALTTHMLYQCIASRSPGITSIGDFVQLWLARWLAHILGAFTLAALGKGVMDLAPANIFSPPFEALGLLLVTLAGIWFLLAAIVMPIRFVTATAQHIQKHLDLRRRKSLWKLTV